MLHLIRRLSVAPPRPMPAAPAPLSHVNRAYRDELDDLHRAPFPTEGEYPDPSGQCGHRVGEAGRAVSSPEDFARAAPAGPGPVRVRISHCFLSSRPKVIDDFSGSSLLSMLRVIQRLVRNLDGPDDIASTIPLAFSKSNQPYIEIGLLTCLFFLVALSAIGAVRGAKAVYWHDYPARVRVMLAQQRIAIALLRLEGRTLGGHRVAPESEAELAPLLRLHAAGEARLAARDGSRQRGCLPLFRHNLQARWDDVAGNGALSLEFTEILHAIVASRMLRSRSLPSEAVCYQTRLVERAERQRHAAKRSRTPEALTAFGMPAMGGGMLVAEAGAGADAVRNAAEKVGNAVRAQAAGQASHALSLVTGGVMMTAQAAQGLSGLFRAGEERRNQQQIRADLAAVEALGGRLDPAIHQLYRQDADARLCSSRVGALFGRMLGVGQGVMFVSNIAHFWGLQPVALGLAIPGATLTVVASIGNGMRESRVDRYCGADTSAELQDGLAEGNLAEQIREQGLASVLDEKADAYGQDQHRIVLCRLLGDLLTVLAREDICLPAGDCAVDRRLERWTQRNQSLRGRGPLLPAGMAALEQMRQEFSDGGFLQGDALQVQQRITDCLWDHPARAGVLLLRKFQQQVLFETLKDLARRRHPQSQPLFHAQDGRRHAMVQGDDAFFAHLQGSPIGQAVYQQRYNEVLAAFLVPCAPFGRSARHGVIGDLAQTAGLRLGMAEQAGLDPDEDDGGSSM